MAVISSCGGSDTAAAQPAPPPTRDTIPPPLTPRQRADQMDAMHEAGVKAFPAKTVGKGNRLMRPKMAGAIKVYELTCSEIEWEVEPGKRVTMTVIAKERWDQPAPWKCDTLNVAPGERWDVLVKATNPGTWAFHCHVLPHAESEHGMFGMVTALIVEQPSA